MGRVAISPCIFKSPSFFLLFPLYNKLIIHDFPFSHKPPHPCNSGHMAKTNTQKKLHFALSRDRKAPIYIFNMMWYSPVQFRFSLFLPFSAHGGRTGVPAISGEPCFLPSAFAECVRCMGKVFPEKRIPFRFFRALCAPHTRRHQRQSTQNPSCPVCRLEGYFRFV